MYPILVKIGSITIHTVSVVHALAFTAGIWWFAHEGKRGGLKEGDLYDISMTIVLWSLVGARIFSVLFDGNLSWYLLHPPEILAVWKGGLTFYGGLLFGLVAGIWQVQRHHLNGWHTADLVAPGLALGLAIGRLGCFASGDSYGRPANLVWAVTFSDRMSLAPTGIPLHPTQLYSVVANLAIFGVLLWWRKRRKFDGEIFLLFVLLYAATRSLVEIFRDDPRGIYLNGLVSTSQIISILAAGIAVAFYFSRVRKTLVKP